VERKKTGRLDRKTNTTYDDVALTVNTKQDDTASGRLANSTYFDALGRVISTVDGLGR
jgi:hypothetical protein